MTDILIKMSRTPYRSDDSFLQPTGTWRLFCFMYSQILFTTSARDNALSPVPRKSTKASESRRGIRKPEVPPFCLFSFINGSSASERKNRISEENSTTHNFQPYVDLICIIGNFILLGNNIVSNSIIATLRLVSKPGKGRDVPSK